MTDKLILEKIYQWEKKPLDPKRKLEFSAFAGDLNSWLQTRKKLYDEHDVVEEIISSQIVQTMNPDYLQAERMALKRSHIPQVINNQIVCSVVSFHKKVPANSAFPENGTTKF